MRQPQNDLISDFDAGVQAGLKTAAEFLTGLAVRVQKPESAFAAPPPPLPTPPAATSRQAAKVTRP
jgi:hypothetical protein